MPRSGWKKCPEPGQRNLTGPLLDLMGRRFIRENGVSPSADTRSRSDLSIAADTAVNHTRQAAGSLAAKNSREPARERHMAVANICETPCIAHNTHCIAAAGIRLRFGH
jgi:hypothetical protein